MENSPHLLQVTLQSIRDAVVTTDQSARVQMLNRAAEAMTGWSSADAAGMPVDQVVALHQAGSRHDSASQNPASPVTSSPVHAALSGGVRVEISQDLILIGKDGQQTSVQVTAAPVQDAAGQVEGCVLVLHDIGESLQLAERISHMAHHDPLTGLPNRILFFDRLEQGTRVADRNSDELAVIFVALDQFGALRLSRGNAVADEMLKEAALRANTALRECDTVCRLGSDEFVILVTGVKWIADVEAVAEKLLADVGAPYRVGEHTFQSSCSIGISIYPRDASDAETLMRLADGAMHQAKRKGSDRYLFARPVKHGEPCADQASKP
jgi:diguanylate cyclase (GGDEF)-like protein/PAS domain S-box-containing protein